MHQNLSIEEGFNVREKADELDCDTDVEIGFVPVGLKGADSKSDLSYHDSAITVNKLAQEEGIELDTFVDYEELDTTRLKSTEVFLGGLHVTYEFLKNNPGTVLTLIQLIKDHYSRAAVDGEAQMSLLIENEDGSVTELDYEGPVDEIDSILEKVDEMTDSETDD
ncbi:hypothetical protein [Halorubrum depositum]|uniref:hypothetical protein n=1 Tax=Halorubrum depositum TaxID=2583992 RepID=UPI0011A5451A|nr:hypothetical protein [Halorubrum depositum]